jgi:hypothetical protein
MMYNQGIMINTAPAQRDSGYCAMAGFCVLRAVCKIGFPTNGIMRSNEMNRVERQMKGGGTIAVTGEGIRNSDVLIAELLPRLWPFS